MYVCMYVYIYMYTVYCIYIYIIYCHISTYIYYILYIYNTFVALPMAVQQQQQQLESHYRNLLDCPLKPLISCMKLQKH